MLAPTVERATQASVRKDPGTLVNILYPVMGPAIRKAIAETLDDTLQGLNQSLRYAFSWRGLKWRIEAWRSGSSFADVVLKHTVVFRVEHVFLIHRKAGLLLEHVAARGRDRARSAAGLRHAQRDPGFRARFVRRGRRHAKAAAIDSLRLGDLLLWCEAGPQAFLAAVIRGTPPESLRSTMRETLYAIASRSCTARSKTTTATTRRSATWRAPAPVSETAGPAAGAEDLSPWLWALPLVLIAAGAIGSVCAILSSNAIADYVEACAPTPGIVVTGVERSGGQWHISGLRDPLAVNTAELLRHAHVEPLPISSSAGSRT